MLSLSKFMSSVSMSGPSATAKPMSAKISTHFVEHLADRMDAALGLRARAARASVTSARSVCEPRVERRRLEHGLARVERRR